MNILCSKAGELSRTLYDLLARYRYRVFVQRLGWQLDTAPDYEQDQFDDEDTVHIIAKNPAGDIVGYGRLLPTTGPYLLESVFPQLLNGAPAPRSTKVWELSRFSAMSLSGKDGLSRRDYMAERVLLQALRSCTSRGVTGLVAVSTPPVERLLLRAGVDFQRFGPPEQFNGQAVLAFMISVNEASIAALTKFEVAAAAYRRPAREAILH